MTKYIQIDVRDVERARELFQETAIVSDDGEVEFPGLSEQEIENAPVWMAVDAGIPGAVVKER